MYYFAYGSNMNWAQMQRRCPSAKFVCVARLVDYAFGITRHSRLRNCGTANVFRLDGREVWGVLYEVSDADLVLLDSYEDGYQREVLPVFALGDGNRPLNALVYIAQVEKDVPLPNAEYKRLMIEGGMYWSLPPSYLAALEAIETTE